jgi:hypothetical protein
VYRAVALLALLLTACGGGGGSSSAGGPLLPPPPPRTTDFGFWYTEPGQLDATAGHVSIVFCQDDQPDIAYGESLLIQCAQEAAAHGVHRWIASVWPFLFTPAYHYVGASSLAPLCLQFAQLGITPTALYIGDELDWRLGQAAATIIPQAAADARAACPGPKIASVYQKTPFGVQALDWFWVDDGASNDAFSKQPPLLPGQEYMPIAYGSTGGADWPMDPNLLVQWIANHAVAAALAFAWASFGNTTGISINGEAPAYLKAGCEITGLC